MANGGDGLNRLFHSICEGIKEGSHVGMIDEETAIVELPLSYSDGSPLTLSVREGGAHISDDGRTLLRLATDGRLSSKDDWEGAQGFWRIHSMKREGAELVFIGKESHQFVRYLEGLRDLEFFASPNRDATKAFDAVVRKKVRSHLSARVKEGQLKKDVEERILYFYGTCVLGLVLAALLVEWTLAPAVFVSAVAGYIGGASYCLAYIRANGGVRTDQDDGGGST